MTANLGQSLSFIVTLDIPKYKWHHKEPTEWPKDLLCRNGERTKTRLMNLVGRINIPVSVVRMLKELPCRTTSFYSFHIHSTSTFFPVSPSLVFWLVCAYFTQAPVFILPFCGSTHGSWTEYRHTVPWCMNCKAKSPIPVNLYLLECMQRSGQISGRRRLKECL